MIVFDNGIYRDMTAEEFAELNTAPPIPYAERVIGRIRERYSVDDELAILRQKDSKPEEYAEYFNFVETIKEEERSKGVG